MHIFSVQGRRRYTLALLSGTISLATACSDEATVIGEPPPGGGGEGPLFAIAAEIETPEGDVLYLDTVPDLLAPFDPVDNGIEIPNASTFKFMGSDVFVAPNSEPTITRYRLDESDRLQQDLTISFAGLGVADAANYVMVSDTKAYLFDAANYVVHVWNPQTMELTGTSIDLSGALHAEYGPMNLMTTRDAIVARGNNLFIPGGWWGNDAPPYPRSLVLVFDTDADTVQVLEDDRCTLMRTVVKSSTGSVYFFPLWFALVTTELPSCALVIRDGQTTFDPNPINAEVSLAGGMALDAFQGPGDFAYVRVPDETRIVAETRPDIVENAGNDMSFWRWNLETGAAEVVPSVPLFNRVRFQFPLDESVLINVERRRADQELAAGAYEVEPTLYELIGGADPVEFPIGIESDEVRARIAEIAQLR